MTLVVKTRVLATIAEKPRFSSMTPETPIEPFKFNLMVAADVRAYIGCTHSEFLVNDRGSFPMRHLAKNHFRRC